MKQTTRIQFLSPFLLIALIMMLSACGQSGSNSDLAARVDSLQARIDYMEQTYKPGLHTLMQQIQVRHATLWFAGDAENWPLADYQLHELEELLEETVALHPVYDEMPIQTLVPSMMNPAVASLEEAIDQQEVSVFRQRFDAFTQACNNCHQATDRTELVVQRPTAPPLTNLRFAPAR